MEFTCIVVIGLYSTIVKFFDRSLFIRSSIRTSMLVRVHGLTGVQHCFMLSVSREKKCEQVVCTPKPWCAS